MAWQNRIVGTGEEAPDQLVANPRNFRIHSHLQEGTIKGVLKEVGWVDHVIVNQRTGFLVDGHARVLVALDENEPTVPVSYVDLTDEEEALILATFDPLGAMAGIDADKHVELLEEVDTDDLYVLELLETSKKAAVKSAEGDDVELPAAGEGGPPEMELQPFEKYDYVVLMFRNTQDWDRAQELLGIGPATYQYATAKGDAPRRKIGVGRVLDGARILDRLMPLRGE
jgi:hypothetical protein